MNKSIYFQSSPAIKIRFPSSNTRGYWAIEEQIVKTTYAVPFTAVLMTIYCAQLVTKETLFKFLILKIKSKLDLLERNFKSLVEKGIIVSQTNHKNHLITNSIEKWDASGWADAADYHFYCWDAPFLDYSQEGNGHEIDRKNMRHYQQTQPDTFRYKEYTNVNVQIPLPPLEPPQKKQPSTTTDKIKYLLSCAFGKVGEKACHWTNTPLIRRSSPSGGCRHPSEGYFIASTCLAINSGIYHICTDPPTLCKLRNQPNTADQVQSYFTPHTLGVIILTTIFEKNMYRYREPRTFRTIHMDIGHILATIEILCEELDLKADIHLNFEEGDILKLLELSKYEEGIMALVGIEEDK